MNRILNNQTVKTFLLSFDVCEHETVLTDLILIGIQTIMRACKSAGRDILKTTIEQTLQQHEPNHFSFGRNNLVDFMNKSKERQPKVLLITEEKEQTFESNKSPKAITKKVTEIVVDSVKQEKKRRIDRRNLDDSQAKQALTDPVESQVHASREKSSKGSRIQDRIEDMPQKPTKIQKTYETYQTETKASPYKSRQQYSTVESKIKDLVRKDRMRRSQLVEQKQRGPDKPQEVPQVSDEFSMFSVESSLDIADRFLSSKVAEQFGSSEPPSFSQSMRKVGMIRHN